MPTRPSVLSAGLSNGLAARGAAIGYAR
jgi:hypothetical protein